jgi:hypothetical protein
LIGLFFTCGAGEVVAKKKEMEHFTLRDTKWAEYFAFQSKHLPDEKWELIMMLAGGNGDNFLLMKKIENKRKH